MPLFELTFPDCLNLPISFLLQEYSIHDLTRTQDYNGFLFSHWIIANNDYCKVQELIDNKFDFSTCNNNSYIPDEVFLVNHLKINTQYYSIPFNKNGYSSIHLCALLHSLQHEVVINEHQNGSKGVFKNNTLKEQQFKIFKSLLEYDPFIFDIKDNNGYTVLDYCFLFENIDLIHLAFEGDSSFRALNNISTSTAFNIIKNLKTKYLNMNRVTTIEINESLLDCLQKKIQYENIDSKAPKKDNSINIIKRKL